MCEFTRRKTMGKSLSSRSDLHVLKNKLQEEILTLLHSCGQHSTKQASYSTTFTGNIHPSAMFLTGLWPLLWRRVKRIGRRSNIFQVFQRKAKKGIKRMKSLRISLLNVRTSLSFSGMHCVKLERDFNFINKKSKSKMGDTW